MPDDARHDGGSPALAEHELLTRLGKYVIERKLGSGGMGTVFLAKDSDLKRTVALKVLAKDRAENPVLVRRFKAEGQAAAYLHHKNIVGVYDSGQIDGFLYIALEFVDGQDVLEIIRKRGVIPVKRSIEIIKQVAEGLQHAYEKQIVHRDIKPSNLLVKNDGVVKLADLGLARSIDETLDTSITRVGTTVGTVDYMSPEQARNSKATDIRSDLYSLGCTWYHMLTGIPPYGEGSVTNKLQAHASAPLPDPRSRNERIPEGVVAVLHRMMAKQAKDRYQTPAELLEDLINPGITRSGLNADVLAALAQPGVRAAQESSSGDIFESRVPFDSVELDAAVNTLRQDALPTGVVFDDEQVDDVEEREAAGESPADHRPRKKPRPEKEAPRGKAPPREEPVEDDAGHPQTPRRPTKSKTSSGDPGKSGPLPRRQSDTERDGTASQTDSSRARFKQRKLPPRESDAALKSEPVRMSLDPDRIRAIILGGIVVAILAGVAYAFSRMSGGGPDSGGASGNAALVAPAQPAQQPVVEPKPEAEPKSPESPMTQETPVIAGEPNDASTPARKTAEPVLGAEDLTDLNSAAAREFVPNWLFQVRKPLAAEAQAVVVRRPGTAGEGVPTIAEAIARLPAGPAIIEFSGDGPFVIAPGSLPARPQILLRAASGSRPVLVFSAGDLKPGESCLRADGNVMFRGLHLVLAATIDTPADIAMIQGSSLSLRDCTLQSVGPGAAGTSLIRLDQSSNDASGCVLENCHLRASAGDGVRLVSAAARMVAGNSLFCFENGRAIVIDPESAGTSAGAGREVTLLRSTVLAGRSAVALEHDSKDPPSPVTLTLRKSSMVAATPAATLLDLQGWPASGETLSDKPTAVGTLWKSEQSTLVGWNVVARMTTRAGATSNTFEGDSGWQKFWRQPPGGTRLMTAGPVLPPDVALVDAAALSEISSVRETDPGCRLALIPSAPAELIKRVRSLSSSRRLPADFIAFRKPTSTVDFDLSKPGPLNAFLNDPSKCPDGALVQLRGVGSRAIPALQIQNRVLHIEFVQLEGAPLVVRPQPGLTAKALITIQGGQISITNGRFQLPESDRQIFPSSLIEVAGGSFAMTNCTLNGPAEESTRLGPLVHWTAGEGPQGMLVRDCVLTGGRTALDVELSGRMLEIDNSILASVSDAVSLSLADAAHPADLTVTSSTLGGGRSIVSTGALAPGSGTALTVIVSDSVALSTQPAGKTSMLKLSSRDDEQRIVWWEDGVGYATSQLPSVTTQTGETDAKPWIERWGAGHVLRVCSSETAVVFEAPLENLTKAELASFRLNSRALAATWSSTGGLLGATGPSLGAPLEAKTAPAPEKGPAKAPAIQPKRPRTVF